MSIFVCGDIHSTLDINKLDGFIGREDLNENDYLIICGDTKTASLRTDLGGRIVTLCDSCVGKFIERRKQRRREIEEKRKEIFEKLKSNGEESD